MYEKVLSYLFGHGLPIYAGIGKPISNVFGSVTNEMKIPIVAAAILGVVWGAFGYILSGEEGVRAAKKRWKQAAIGVVITIGATYAINWLAGKARGIF